MKAPLPPPTKPTFRGLLDITIGVASLHDHFMQRPSQGLRCLPGRLMGSACPSSVFSCERLTRAQLGCTTTQRGSSRHEKAQLRLAHSALRTPHSALRTGNGLLTSVLPKRA